MEDISKHMKHLFFSLAALLMVSTALAQEVVTCSPQKTLWYIKGDKANYALTLPSKPVATDLPQVLMVDNIMFQYLIVDRKAYNEEGDNSQETTLPLIRHVTEESQYLSGIYKSDLNLQMQLEALAGDKKALYWFFEVPGAKKGEVKVQHYLEVLCGDVIFCVASSQFEGQATEQVKALLINTLGSLATVKDKNNLCK